MLKDYRIDDYYECTDMYNITQDCKETLTTVMKKLGEGLFNAKIELTDNEKPHKEFDLPHVPLKKLNEANPCMIIKS